MISLLEELSNINSVSGNEVSVRKFIINEIKKTTAEIKTDNMNNLYVFRNGFGQNKKKILLCAHMDEVGFIVSSITKEGTLKFRTVGGVDTLVITGKRVVVGENNIKGVIGIKPVHLAGKEERKKNPDISSLCIDIGCDSYEEAKSLVKVGDYVSFDTTFSRLGNLIKGKAFDDRVGCFILLNLLKNNYYDDIVYCFTTQEETGLRGAFVASSNIDADLCYVLECTTCLDFPEIPSYKTVTNLGKGPALSIIDGYTFANKELNKMYSSYSEKMQYKESFAGGNDAGAIHINNIKTTSVSVPARYLHSPVLVADYNDISECINTFDKMLSKGVCNL